MVLCVVGLGQNNMFQQLFFDRIFVQKGKDKLALAIIT
jgi:hypothetical protein